jgi:riboflavin kinase/FMN adenylyltransferase
VRDILVNKIGVKTLVIGYNHHFGRNREGTFEQLQELAPVYNFDIEEISAEEINHLEISSTKIRNALLTGDVKTAASYLGRNYSIKGTVIKGKQLGRGIGFPTANIEPDDKYKLIPANGVYAVEVEFDNKNKKGLLYIGSRLNDKVQKIGIELHILNLNEDIYHKSISMSFICNIRKEKNFDEDDELKKQIEADKKIISGFEFRVG